MDDMQILNIVQNKSLYSGFPQLELISKKIYHVSDSVAKSTCKCNSGKKLRAANSTNVAVTEMKNYIKRMAQAEREKFKAALNVKELRFTMKDATGVLKEYRY